jgi:hypothetical protein
LILPHVTILERPFSDALLVIFPAENDTEDNFFESEKAEFMLNIFF